jgi:uncharacterized membrane protein YphA (DoxX/SURF4 family)
MPTPDPVYVLAARLLMAGIFLSGGIEQWRDRASFEGVVAGYGLVPAGLVAAVALLLPLAEIAAGLGLLVPAAQPLASAFGLGLLTLVTTAVVINLARGRTDIDCGCGGANGEQRLSWSLVARNVVLGFALVVAAMPTTTREAGAADLALAIFAGLAGLGLYASANQLLANAPRLRALRDGTP